MFRRRGVVLRSRPSGPVDLLLRAGLAPEDEAQRAWVAWSKTRDFEHISGAERRLLAAFSERIGKLDPSSPLGPRVDGLTKLLWTRAQLTLVQTAEAFDQLARVPIPFLVFKGGALLAEGFVTSRRRVIGDIDLLVRRESAVAAVDALTCDGWSSVNGESPPYLRRLANTRISGNYRKGQYGELDLHISPFHFARLDESLDQALWRDARIASLAGHDVLIPDAADAIVISLAHAPMGGSAEWALDVVTRIANQPIDWDKVSHVARERGLVPSCLAGLQYLRDALCAPVPESVLTRLQAAPVTFGSWLKYWSNVSDRKDRNLLEKATNRFADRLLRRQGYAHFVKDRVEVTVARPSVLPGRLWSSGKALSVPASTLATRHEFLVAHDAVGRRLVIKVAVPRPPMSRRIFFDVTADGLAVARLRCRLGPPERIEKTLTFVLPYVRSGNSDTRISIDSRPTGYLPPNAAHVTQAEVGAVQFRLLKATVQ